VDFFWQLQRYYYGFKQKKCEICKSFNISLQMLQNFKVI
jgi:hypothetical protein